MTKEEVTVAVFIAKKNMLRRRERIGGSDAGNVSNGHMETALASLRRLWTILCVALVKSSIKLIFQINTKSCISIQICIPDCAPSYTWFSPYLGCKIVFYRLLDFQLYNFSVYPGCHLYLTNVFMILPCMVVTSSEMNNKSRDSNAKFSLTSRFCPPPSLPLLSWTFPGGREENH
jgi:hypothetical protein